MSVQRKADSKWIDYAGHQFRMGNVLEAKLGKYGYKISQHTFHAEGDLPTGVTLSTNYPTNFDYNGVLALKKLGANVPNIAEAQIGAERGQSGKYKLYVLQAANEREWKNIIRDAIKSGDEDLVEQMRRPDSYFRFVDASLGILYVAHVGVRQIIAASLEPRKRPAAADSGECQSESEHSPVYLGSPPAKRQRCVMFHD